VIGRASPPFQMRLDADKIASGAPFT